MLYWGTVRGESLDLWLVMFVRPWDSLCRASSWKFHPMDVNKSFGGYTVLPSFKVPPATIKGAVFRDLVLTCILTSMIEERTKNVKRSEQIRP